MQWKFQTKTNKQTGCLDEMRYTSQSFVVNNILSLFYGTTSFFLIYNVILKQKVILYIMQKLPII